MMAKPDAKSIYFDSIIEKMIREFKLIKCKLITYDQAKYVLTFIAHILNRCLSELKNSKYDFEGSKSYERNLIFILRFRCAILLMQIPGRILLENRSRELQRLLKDVHFIIKQQDNYSVSYTHLTLPTNREV